MAEYDPRSRKEARGPAARFRGNPGGGEARGAEQPPGAIGIWHGRALFLLFATAALALGSSRPLAQAAVTALAAAVFVLGLIERGLWRRGPGLDEVGISLIALTLFTFTQIVPLPPWLLGVVSARSLEIHDGAWAALGIAHRDGWFPVSLDPPATGLAAMRMTAITLTYLTVRQRLRAHGARSVLGPVVGAGALVAGVFLLHRLAGWSEVYDEYTPRYVLSEIPPAPFVNANHLAGALGFTATLAFGLALSSVDRFRRLTMIAAGVFTGGACLLTLSRGGIIAFAAGQILFAVLRIAGRRSAFGPAEEERRERAGGDERGEHGEPGGHGDRGRGGRHGVGWLSLGTLLALGAGAYVSYDAIVREFAIHDASKLEIPRDAWAMALDHPYAGIGRGAFIAAYPPYQTQPDTATYTHPENLPMQFVSEWGLIAGGAAVLGLLFLLGRAVVRPPLRAFNAAATAAVFVLLLQNLVDFGLELLGLALPFVAALAVVREVGAVGDDGRVRYSHRSRLAPGWAWLSGAAVAAATVAALYPWAAANDLEAETDRFRAYARSETYDPSIVDEGREAFARHPADYYLPFLAGVHASRTGGPGAIRFWNQSLRLRPTYAGTHFAVGAFLARVPGARAQAAEEYGTAVRYRPGALGAAAAAVVRMAPEFEDTAPFLHTTGLDPIDVWDALAVAYDAEGNAKAAAGADAAILHHAPAHAAARVRRARALLSERAPAAALREIRLAGWRSALAPPTFLLGARALEVLDRADEALALLESTPAAARTADVVLALADAYAKRGDMDRAIRTVSGLEAGARTQRERTDAVVQRANFLVRWNRPGEALVEIRRAASFDPGRLDLWKTAADLAERLNDTAGAVWALRELVRRSPADAALRERLRRIEQEAAQRRLLRAP